MSESESFRSKVIKNNVCRLCGCVFVWVCECECVCLNVCMCVSVWVCSCLCVFVCVSGCLSVCEFVWTVCGCQKKESRIKKSISPMCDLIQDKKGCRKIIKYTNCMSVSVWVCLCLSLCLYGCLYVCGCDCVCARVSVCECVRVCECVCVMGVMGVCVPLSVCRCVCLSLWVCVRAGVCEDGWVCVWVDGWVCVCVYECVAFIRKNPSGQKSQKPNAYSGPHMPHTAYTACRIAQIFLDFDSIAQNWQSVKISSKSEGVHLGVHKGVHKGSIKGVHKRGSMFCLHPLRTLS